MIRVHTVLSFFVTAALLVAAPVAMAQETPDALPTQATEAKIEPVKTTYEKEMEKVVKAQGESSFITLNVENDMFAWGGKDGDYTNGVRLTYHKVGAPLPEFARALDTAVPMFRTNQATNIYYSVGHNLYTPSDITVQAQAPNERPWAAYLYGAAGMSTVRKNRIDEIEASIGIIGPAALGEQIQKTYHKWIDSPEPEGWRNQLKNEPALMLSWNRRFPNRYDVDLPEILESQWTLTAEPNIGVTVGNVYTYANAGASFRFSPFEGRYQDAPIRVRPAMPGTGSFMVPDQVFAWNFFGGVEGRAVAQNIFLDGNTFTDSHSVDKEPFVYDATLGVAAAYGKTRVSYAFVYRSREFKEQADPALFGTVTLSYRF